MRLDRVGTDRIGTYEGSVGDQYQRADSEIVLDVVDTHIDPEADEAVLELAVEATDAKRACRIQLALSETEGRHLAESIHNAYE